MPTSSSKESLTFSTGVLSEEAEWRVMKLCLALCQLKMQGEPEVPPPHSKHEEHLPNFAVNRGQMGNLDFYIH